MACPEGVLVGQGGSVSVIGLSVLISFAPQSIVIAGQDLVYDGTAWHSRLTRHKDNFDGAAAGDSSCQTLRAQDGTLRHISSDWKMCYNQI